MNRSINRYREMAKAMEGYTLPEGVLPLARDRKPFEDLSTEAVAKLIRIVSGRAGKVGRLVDALRDEHPWLPEVPDSGTVIEAHLDCTKVPQDLQNTLVSLGFEPDHFVEFVPDIYPDHFTLKYVVMEGVRETFRDVKRATGEVIKLLEMRDVHGYIEVEVYNPHMKVVMPFEVPRSYTPLPFRQGSLEEVPIPDSIGSEVFKRADIHVKTPTVIRAAGYEMADCDRMQRLRQELINVGFYPVLTEAGNRVLTAQFLKAADARLVYKQLRDHFLKHGGIVDICLEPCVFFWRSHDGKRLASIPPVVRLAD